MTSKKISVVQADIKMEKELKYFIETNHNMLICLEVYCDFAGPCHSLVPTLKSIKFGIGDGKMVFAKVSADKIDDLKRFRNKSEPIYLFMSQGAVTRVIRGANIQQMINAATEEYQAERLEKHAEERRPRYSLDTLTLSEEVWRKKEASLEEAKCTAALQIRESRQAARKLWRAERMVPALANLNFIIFWPHAHRAHFDLYEKWDENGISVLAKEEVQLSKDIALDVLYMSDVDLNEAALNALLQGPALTVCFIKHDDRNFVELMRYILYKSQDEIRNRQSFQQGKTAFEYFGTFSLTREEIYTRRLEDRERLREETRRRFARRRSEITRLAKEAKEEARNLRREQKQQERLAKLKAGINIPVTEEDSSEDDENENITEVFTDYELFEEEEIMKQDEYVPPAGLFIPGFYSPPNEAAKTNALSILFPKIVADWCTPEDEFLPPCLLVKLPVSKRMELAASYDEIKANVIHMGFFRENSVGAVEHIAFSINEYNKLHRIPDPAEYIAVMVSVSSDLSLLKLLTLEPQHISMDPDSGYEECALLFPVGYADDEDDNLSTLSDEDDN